MLLQTAMPVQRRPPPKAIPFPENFSGTCTLEGPIEEIEYADKESIEIWPKGPFKFKLTRKRHLTGDNATKFAKLSVPSSQNSVPVHSPALVGASNLQQSDWSSLVIQNENSPYKSCFHLDMFLSDATKDKDTSCKSSCQTNLFPSDPDGEVIVLSSDSSSSSDSDVFRPRSPCNSSTKDTSYKSPCQPNLFPSDPDGEVIILSSDSDDCQPRTPCGSSRPPHSPTSSSLTDPFLTRSSCSSSSDSPSGVFR